MLLEYFHENGKIFRNVFVLYTSITNPYKYIIPLKKYKQGLYYDTWEYDVDIPRFENRGVTIIDRRTYEKTT